MSIDKRSTPEELERLRSVADAELPETIARAERSRQTMQEQSVSGQLRRAIAAEGFRYKALAEETGITVEDLSDFMTGDLALPLTAIDRFAEAMHQKLVAAK